MRRKLICANWKMNHTLIEAVNFFNDLPFEKISKCDADIAIFPSFPLIHPLRQYIEGTPITLGAQNINENPKGAFTGEVSASILKSVGAEWVIIGHSERRDIFKESDELISKKLKAAIAGGLKVILCVGEHLDTRRAGQEIETVKKQLEMDFFSITSDEMQTVSIAYEPVWAIGTGLAAKPSDAESMMSFIRDWLDERFGFDIASSVRILYGGSVTPKNIATFADKSNFDGALVGGASLNPLSFTDIILAIIQG